MRKVVGVAWFAAGLALGLGTVAAPAVADVAAGQRLFRAGAGGTPACAPCHDPAQATDAVPGTPRLAGQQAGYLIKELKSFRSGVRRDRVMTPAAAPLSDAQIADVAAYLSGLRAPHRPSRDHLTPQQAQRAAMIFSAGLPAQGLAACSSCHGPRGGGAPEAPMIASQDSAYALARLRALAGLRGDPMQPIAAKLGGSDSAIMAAYLATLRP
jgi:cytochrome c553